MFACILLRNRYSLEGSIILYLSSHIISLHPDFLKPALCITYNSLPIHQTLNAILIPRAIPIYIYIYR